MLFYPNRKRSRGFAVPAWPVEPPPAPPLPPLGTWLLGCSATLAVMYAERLLVLVLLGACAPAPSKAPPREGGPGTRVLPLTEGWRLQSGALVPEPDSAVASPGYAAAGWLPTQVPTTVSGAHVQAGAHGDPFFGMNLRDLPGVDYPVGEGFGTVYDISKYDGAAKTYAKIRDAYDTFVELIDQSIMTTIWGIK